MRVTIRPYKNIDWFTVVLYLVLVAFGWINIYAVNYNPEAEVFFDTSNEYTKQLIWIGISFVTAGLIFLFDSKFLVEFSYIFYAITTLLLILTLLIGVEINAARAWFDIGGMRFQPAELSKVATALALSRVMSRYNFRIAKPANLAKMGLVIFLPFIIIIFQNDTGTALIYLAFFLVFFREGMSPFILFLGMLAAVIFILSLLYDPVFIVSGLFLIMAISIYFIGQRKTAVFSVVIAVVTFVLIYASLMGLNREVGYTLPLFSSLAATALYLIIQSLRKRMPRIVITLLILLGMVGYTYTTDYFFNDVLSDYQRNRVLVMLGLEDDPQGIGYNVNQSKIAIGSGGFYGKGFLDGTQTKYEFVPEQSTDFIYCTVGEEWGFLGTSMVIILFITLLFRVILLSERQHSAFTRIYGYSVAAIFLFHITINIGMTIGLAPVIGIPLPFFSYGGSSLWGFSILLFILLKLDTNRAELIR